MILPDVATRSQIAAQSHTVHPISNWDIFEFVFEVGEWVNTPTSPRKRCLLVSSPDILQTFVSGKERMLWNIVGDDCFLNDGEVWRHREKGEPQQKQH